MKILLIDDHELIRFGMRRLIEGLAQDAEVIEAASLQRGAAMYEDQGDIDLVLLDLHLPDARGLSGLRRFARRHPDARLVVLSGTLEDAIASEALAIGAQEFLHKTSDVRALRDRMNAILARVRSGERVTAPDPAPPAGGGGAARRGVQLSELDLRILDLLLQGHTNREIADATDIAVGTAKNRISGLLAAFGVTSRARLMALFH